MTDDEIMRASGSDYCCGYRQLHIEAESENISAYCTVTRRLFAHIAKSFSAEENSRWVIRHYLAIKFIAASSLLAGSAAYAFDRNLLMGVPYFNYYSVLNACRGFLLTSPHLKWDGDKTVKMTHEKILNCTADYLRHLDPTRRVAWRNQLAALREQRELFSYHFPLSGPDFVGRESLDPGAAADLGRLIAEMASLNSECFQAALKKHASGNLPVLPLPDHTWASVYQLAGVPEYDRSDRYRFDKLVRQWGTVSTLEVMTSEGLLDDLFGSWTDPDNDDEDAFNPDRCSGLMLAFR